MMANPNGYPTASAHPDDPSGMTDARQRPFVGMLLRDQCGRHGRMVLNDGETTTATALAARVRGWLGRMQTIRE